ncbi:hypothetical protein LJB86_05055 [Deltaproteobacteria bacterium OttesenSCG-928-M10]|nr:hypothetical protein [Deltaproteobacteria bacterium OttesenSCG-928-M10]
MTDKQFDGALKSAGGWFFLTQYEEIADYTGEKKALVDYMFTKGFDAKRGGTSTRVSSVLRIIKNQKGKDALAKIRDSKKINTEHSEAEELASEIIAKRFK